MNLHEINNKYAPAVNAAYDDLVAIRQRHNARCGFGEVTNEDRLNALSDAREWVFAEFASHDGVTHREWRMAHAKKFLEATPK